MEKKTTMTMVLLFSALSLIYIVISYFGLDRFLLLRFKNPEHYIKNYSELDICDDNKVVISFTTIPENTEKIKPMINSILDQTAKVDQIALNIPNKYKNKSYNLPDYFKDCLNVYRVGKDNGKSTCVIPTLKREGEKNTKIICVKDNVIYGKDFIETIVDESNKNPDKAIQSKNCILVKPRFFDTKVLDYTGKKLNMKWIQENLKVGIIKLDYSENYSF